MTIDQTRHVEQKSYCHWFEQHQKKCSVTAIALVAIAFAVVGFLAIAAALSAHPTGWGGLSQIPFPFGLLCATSGSLCLLSLVLWQATATHAKKNEKKEQETIQISNQDSSSFNPIEPVLKRITSQYDLSDYQRFPSPFQESFWQIVHELNIDDIAERIHGRYDDDKMPTLQLAFDENRAQIEEFAKQLPLLLMNDNEILNLRMNDILTYDTSQMRDLQMRVSLLEENPELTGDSVSLELKISLREFRDLKGSILQQILTMRNDFSIFLSLTTKIQAEQFLSIKNIKLSKDIMLALLPLHSSYLNRTENYLQKIPFSILKPHLGFLSEQHVRLLPDHILASQSFPWTQIIQSKEQAQMLFPLDIIDRKRTQEILQLLDEQVLIKLVPFLSGGHLRLLKTTQLQSKNFPWDGVSQKKEVMAVLFATDHLHKKQTEEILQLLDASVLNILFKSGYFSAEIHMLMLTQAQQEQLLEY